MNQIKKHQFRNSLLLLLAALIWGVAFVAQSVGMDYVGPFTFSFTRNFLGCAVLLPVIALQRSKAGTSSRTNDLTTDQESGTFHNTGMLIKGGISCGIVLFLAANFQQFGIMYTTVGKAGFITASYIILVPIAGIFLGKKCTPLVWAAVLLSLAGLYMLCINGPFSLNRGDLLMMICAVLFTGHILVIDHFSPKVNGVAMSCIQFFVCGVLSLICALLFENIVWSKLLSAWIPIGYAGIFSCGVAYTLQIVGQKSVDPTIASLLLSLESSFSVIAGWLILGQRMSRKELSGCVFMFIAIILAQIPVKTKEKG